MDRKYAIAGGLAATLYQLFAGDVYQKVKMPQKICSQYRETDIRLQKLPLIYFVRDAQLSAAAAPTADSLAVGRLEPRSAGPRR
jgi:hypothetical protein